MIQLYGSYTSPYVRHCRVSLLDTNTPFEFIEADTALRDQVTPTMKVPYLEQGTLKLHDSQSIIQYVRQLARQSAFPKIEDLDIFLLANTILDTAVNVYLLKRSHLDEQSVPYLHRQSQRITTLLKALEPMVQTRPWAWDDTTIRIACMVSWLKVRGFNDFADLPALWALNTQALTQPNFAATQPTT